MSNAILTYSFDEPDDKLRKAQSLIEGIEAIARAYLEGNENSGIVLEPESIAELAAMAIAVIRALRQDAKAPTEAANV